MSPHQCQSSMQHHKRSRNFLLLILSDLTLPLKLPITKQAGWGCLTSKLKALGFIPSPTSPRCGNSHLEPQHLRGRSRTIRSSRSLSDTWPVWDTWNLFSSKEIIQSWTFSPNSTQQTWHIIGTWHCCLSYSRFYLNDLRSPGSFSEVTEGMLMASTARLSTDRWYTRKPCIAARYSL